MQKYSIYFEGYLVYSDGVFFYCNFYYIEWENYFENKKTFKVQCCLKDDYSGVFHDSFLSKVIQSPRASLWKKSSFNVEHEIFVVNRYSLQYFFSNTLNISQIINGLLLNLSYQYFKMESPSMFVTLRFVSRWKKYINM